MTDGEVVYFLNTLRAALRLEPLPKEGRYQPYLFTLDGVRKQSAEQWAAELGIGRTTAIFRAERLAEDLRHNRPDAYAKALGPNYGKPTQRKRDPVSERRRALHRAARKRRAARSSAAGAEG